MPTSDLTPRPGDALVIVDVQVGMLQIKPPVHEGAEVLARLKELVARACRSSMCSTTGPSWIIRCAWGSHPTIPVAATQSSSPEY